MSGTSLDGIDLAEVNFSLLNNRTWDYKVLNTETVFLSQKLESQFDKMRLHTLRLKFLS